MRAIPDTPAAGIALMAAAMMMAPGMDVCAKLLGDTMSPAAIAIWRFIAQLGFLIPMMLWAGSRGPLTRLHLFGGLCLATAIVSINAALAVMPLANTIAIFFVEPLILTVLSALILGEGIGWRRLLGVVTGLIGALIVIRPAWDQFGLAAILPLITAFAFAGYLIVNRVLSRRGDRLALQFWIAAAALAVLAVASATLGHAAGFLAFSIPVMPDVPLILLQGIIAAVGHQLVAQALARAEAGALAPLQYLEIISAVAFGWLIFGDLPDAFTWTGTAIIVASGLYVFYRERVTPAP